MNDYKYLKYKNKYNNLKNNLKMVGGNAQHVRLILANSPTLTTADLSGSLKDIEIRHRCLRAIAINTTLTDLFLDYNIIDDESAQLIEIILINNKTLKTLHFSYNQFSNIGIQTIARGLMNYSALNELNLVCNNIGDIGAHAIAEALKYNTMLTILYLNNNNITDIGGISIAEALKVNKSLNLLNIVFNNITDEGNQVLADALEYNYTIKYLEIDPSSQIIEDRIDKYCEENRQIEDKFKKIFTKVRHMIIGMNIIGRLPAEIWRQIILEHFELSLREQNYYYILENQLCPCRGDCTGDAMEPCFIQNLYMKERSSETVPAASEDADGVN